MTLQETPTLTNLTPHALSVRDNDGREVLSLPPSGAVARVTSATTSEGTLLGVPLASFKFGEVEGLPEPRAGHLFVVSGMVFEAAQDRRDLLAPGELVRDDAGRPCGCRGFKCRAGGL